MDATTQPEGNSGPHQSSVEKPNLLETRGAEIHYLIYHQDEPSGEFIVFVDKDLDLDWECDDRHSELIDTPELVAAVRNTLNAVGLLEPIAHNWPDDLKLASKRILGEAIVTVMQGDKMGAKDAVRNARAFFREKSEQVSRFWILQACLVFGGVATVLGILEVLTRDLLVESFGATFYILALCFSAGCFGAVFFVGMKLGKQPQVDSTAERCLHFLEGLTRVAGGGIAGVLTGSMIKLGFILPMFSQSKIESFAMCAVAIVAGASERLAAGIVTKVEQVNSNKTEAEDADNQTGVANL